MGLVVEAAGEGEFGPVNVSARVHELDRLLEALDAAGEFGETPICSRKSWEGRRGLTPMSQIGAAMVVAPGNWWRRVGAWWGRRSR
jgi:hypothetical protein